MVVQHIMIQWFNVGGSNILLLLFFSILLLLFSPSPSFATITIRPQRLGQYRRQGKLYKSMEIAAMLNKTLSQLESLPYIDIDRNIPVSNNNNNKI